MRLPCLGSSPVTLAHWVSVEGKLLLEDLKSPTVALGFPLQFVCLRPTKTRKVFGGLSGVLIFNSESKLFSALHQISIGLKRKGIANHSYSRDQINPEGKYCIVLFIPVSGVYWSSGLSCSSGSLWSTREKLGLGFWRKGGEEVGEGFGM